MVARIQLRRDILGVDPVTGDLKEGELAYAYASDKLFIGGPAAGSVLQIGGASVISLLTATPGVATADKAVILDSNTKIDVWNVAGLVEADTFKTNASVNAGFVKNDASGNLLFGQTGEQTDLNLTDLADATISPSPILNQYLCFDGSEWVNAFVAFDNLSDVTLTSPASGEILSFDGLKWVNIPSTTLPGIPTVLDDLTDVDTITVAPVLGDVLTFDGGSLWEPAAPVPGGATNLNALSDVTLSGLATGEFLRLNGVGQFVNVLIVEADIDDLQSYALAVHTHVEADITDLGTYSEVGHTHVEADITDLGTYSEIGHTHLEADITDLQNYSLVSHTHLEADITDLKTYLLNITSEPIGDLSDVILILEASGEYLRFDGTNWRNAEIVEADISDLGTYSVVGHSHVEVDITDLQAYLLDITAENIGDLSDVSSLPPSSGQHLVWTGSEWAPSTFTNSFSISDASDVQNAAASDKDFMRFSSGFGEFVFGSASSFDLVTLTDLQTLTNKTLTNPSIDQISSPGTLTVSGNLDIGPSNFSGGAAILSGSLSASSVTTTGDVTAFDFKSTNPAASTPGFVKNSASGTLLYGQVVSLSLDDLTGVFVPTPSNNQLLTFVTGNNRWEAVSLAQVMALDDLTDVDLTAGGGPVAGEHLEFDGIDWVPAPATGPLGLNDLTDVILFGVGTGNFLRHNGSEFVNTTLIFTDLPAITVDDLSDVSAGSPSTNEVLTFNSTSGNWEAAAPSSGSLDSLTNVVLAGVIQGNVLHFDGSDWVNTSTPEITEIRASDGRPIVAFSDEFAGVGTDHSYIELISGTGAGSLDGPVIRPVSGAHGDVDLVFHTKGSGCFRFRPGSFNPVEGFVKNDAQGELLLGQPSAIPFDDLLDVFVPSSGPGSPNNQDILTFIVANNRWEAKPFGDIALGELTDVTITTPALDSLLQFDGSQWIDQVNLVIDSTAATYWGSIATNDTWRVIRTGDDLAFERRESSNYIEKAKFTATSFVTVGSITGASYARSGISQVGFVKHDDSGNFIFEDLIQPGDLPTNGYDLDDLGNVSVASPTLGYHLEFDGFEWIAAAPGHTAPGASELNDLSDVTLSSPDSGEFLRHNGSGQFVNVQIVEADIFDLQSYLLNITSENFTDLSDTPADYSGASSRFVKVNSGGDALEFVDVLVSVTALNELSDVTLTTEADGDFLRHNGSGQFVNVTIADADVPDDLTLERIEIVNPNSTGTSFQDSSNRDFLTISTHAPFAPSGNIRIETGVGAGASDPQPRILVEGTETNIGLQFETKGTGKFIFQPDGSDPSSGVLNVDSSGNLLFNQGVIDSEVPNDLTLDRIEIENSGPGLRFEDSGNKVYLRLSQHPSFSASGNIRIETGVGPGTAPQPRILVEGTETNIGLQFETKGTGKFIFQPSGGNPDPGLLSVDSSGNLLFNTTLTDTDIPDDLTLGTVSGNVAFTGNILPGADVIMTTTTAAFYLGDPTTNGTWRIVRDIGGTEDLLIQERITNSWVTKGSFST